MKNFEIKNTKNHLSQNLAKANALRYLQINFNQAKDALTIPLESRHDHKCGSATQSGRSMIEMLGVLAIIGVLSVGGIAGYSKAMMKYRINKTIDFITYTSQSIRTFFASQRGYKVLNWCYEGEYKACTLIKKAKLVPDEVWLTSAEDGKEYVYDAFGNNVHIQSYTNVATENQGKGFIISFNGMTLEACIELASMDWSSVSGGFIGMGIDQDGIVSEIDQFCIDGGSSSVSDTAVYACTKDTQFPLPLDKVVSACSKQSDESRGLSFLFK